ncbi:hypothetical protein LCGC14_2003320 [marine sediment metagenome]|uniref:Uncharacterized protein n=1 Tax=marine sediment metagenome TaxID=412755 RepID=A0A0F9FQ87_9ZZZZ
MDGEGFLVGGLILILVGEAVWIRCLTLKYYALQDMVGRASAQVAQHKIMVSDLKQLIEDDEDLDRCLRDEINGKAWARAREVEYEQNKARWDEDAGPDHIPWVPKENPK